MIQSTDCPDPQELERLAKKGGEPDEIDRLAGHLETCEMCGRALETMLSADDTFGGSPLSSLIAVPSGPELDRAKENVRGLGPAAQLALANDATLSPDLARSASRIQSPADHRTESGLDFLAPPERPDEIGRLGPFRILKKLGAGGMGIVFLAEDTALHRQVAIKTLQPGIAADATARDRFLREARSAASIEQENVVAIYQVGEEAGIPYLAMPLLRGESLEDRLQRTPVLPVAEALNIARQVATGLDAAHHLGMIHRDIKPGNLFLLPPASGAVDAASPLIKILDFGLARTNLDATRITQSGMIVGTPAYLAPEQARGEPVDGRSDLFSLGCVLYQMLTGHLPFTGQHTLAILSALALHDPPAPSAMNPQVPKAVSDLTMRLLAKKPADRFASARELITAIDNVNRGSAQPAAAPSPQVAPRRRRPTLVAALLLATLFAAGMTVLSGTIIRIATNKGQLVIENPGDGVEVVIQQEGKEPRVQVIDRQSQRTFNLAVGDYVIDVKEKDGLAFKTSKFTLTRGGVERIRVELERNKVATAITEPKPREPWTHRRVAEWTIRRGGKVWIGDQQDIARIEDLPARFERIDQVNLDDDKAFGDDQLREITDWPAIAGISLNGTSITDAGLRHLAKLKLGGALSLKNTRITGEGFDGFANKSLGTLLLHGCSLTPEGWRNLARVGHTSVWGLSATNLDDDKLETILAVHPEIKTLLLQDTPLTDESAERIARLPNLRDVKLGKTLLTDKGFAKLALAKGLTKIDLYGAVISAETLAELKKALPLCRFELSNTIAPVVTSPRVQKPVAPEGFRAIFNGRDLTGWHGMNPHDVAKLTDEKKKAALEKQRAEFSKFWTVKDGELINDGHGPYATTDEDFGDIELRLEYKTVPDADSGIYLRGTPQVQIWDWNQVYDPKQPWRKPHLGSGGLFNNSNGAPGRDPLVRADRPFGEWNAFRIRQIGDRTWVWLNDRLVVDGAVMENFWDRKQPLPKRGPIMLQTHGGEIRWRNIFVREISPGSTPNEGTTTVTGPIQIAEPPPLTEWLKGRTVLTVSQDGKGQYKTIQAALDALKPGQVVKVLDRGPYRETLRCRVPADSGLISEVQTVLEHSGVFDNYQFWRNGHRLGPIAGFRLHGFKLVFPHLTQEDCIGLSIPQGDGFTLENCVIQSLVEEKLRPVMITDQGAVLSRATVVRDCVFDGGLHYTGKSHGMDLLVQRCHFLGPRHIVQPAGRFRQIVIRDNVFTDKRKCDISLYDLIGSQTIDICNNTFASDQWLLIAEPGKDLQLRLRNNLTFEMSKGFVLRVEGNPAESVQGLEVGNNVFLSHAGANSPGVVPLAATDRVAAPKLLSRDPAHRDFLRMAADDPLAKSGAGGEWPTYVGALPPGPAPKEGDWFTRLRERWGEVKPEKKADAGPIQIPEPPPLADWLKGRTVLTVSQDGKGQYKTIQAALDALKPGQVVKVLDRGPYREYLRPSANLPLDTGLVSDQGTLVEAPEGEPDWKRLDYNAKWTLLHRFRVDGGFRLHGLIFSFPKAKNYSMGLAILNPDGAVVENCSFRLPAGEQTIRSLGLWVDKRSRLARPAVVRECVLDGPLGINVGAHCPESRLDALVARNWFAISSRRQPTFIQAAGPLCHLVAQENIFSGPGEHQFSLYEFSSEGTAITNNTFAGHCRIVLQKEAPRGPLQIRNNLFARGGGIFLVAPEKFVAPSDWLISHNRYGEQLTYWDASIRYEVLPLGPTEAVAQPTFQSDDPATGDYLRPKLSDSAATGGAGGALPRHLGALPPGPAPKEGDWFTRLRERWSAIRSEPSKDAGSK